MAREDERSDEQCCSAPPPTSAEKRSSSRYELTTVGKVITIPVDTTADRRGSEKDLEIYITGPGLSRAGESGGKALICIYDIFGTTHPSVHHGADLLSHALQMPILVPDLFRRGGWSTSNMPPKEGRPFMQEYIASLAPWPLIAADLLAVREYLGARHGVTDVGCYGFCFGGKKIAQAAADERTRALFKAVALVHPTRLAVEDADLFTCPVALVPSGGEDGEVMDGFWEALQKREVGDRCVRKDFLEDPHGFASARADWDDPLKAARVRQVYDLMADFFRKNL